MPYSGTPKDIKIPESIYYRYMSVKGKNSHKDTMTAMVEVIEILYKIFETKNKDAVTIKKRLEKVVKEEGLL